MTTKQEILKNFNRLADAYFRVEQNYVEKSEMGIFEASWKMSKEEMEALLDKFEREIWEKHPVVQEFTTHDGSGVPREVLVLEKI